jgi:hypothetical protein
MAHKLEAIVYLTSRICRVSVDDDTVVTGNTRSSLTTQISARKRDGRACSTLTGSFPTGLEPIAECVIPELRKRGTFCGEYTPCSFRLWPLSAYRH